MSLTFRALLVTAALGSIAACTAFSKSEPAAPSPSAVRHQLIGLIMSTTDAPIAGAKLTVVNGPDAGARVATDASGHYGFASLAGGRFSMVIEAPGFEPATPIVDLPRDLSVDFALRRIP